MSRTHGESTQPVSERPQIYVSSFLQVFPGYCSLRRWLLALVDGTWGRTYFVSFLGLPLFSSCGGFSVVLAFFGDFCISADSRFGQNVASSSQPRKLDGNPLIWVVRGSPPVVSWHTLDRNLPIWVVRGSPPVVRWPTLDGNPAILRQGPALRAKARQELHGSAVPLGLPFDLNYEVYASSCSTSSGALGQSPRGTQGIFQDTLNKMFSFREEEGLQLGGADGLSFLKAPQPTQQLFPRVDHESQKSAFDRE